VDDRRNNKLPQLFRGVFANGDQVVQIDHGIEQLPSMDYRAYVRQVRRTCDALYYVFLRGYTTGLEAYWNRSVERGKSQGEGRESTPGWYNATVMAKRALGEAVSAWNLHQEGELEESKVSAEKALQFLIERYVLLSEF